MKLVRISMALTVAAMVALTGYTLEGQAGTGLPWTSNFEAGNFSEWNGGYRSTNNLHVTESGCFSGRCARTDIVPGTVGSNYADKHFGDWFNIGGTKVEEVWLRFYSKFSAGLTWPNRSQKMAIINLTNGVDNERRYQVYVYVTPNGRYAVDHSDIGSWQFYGLSQNVGTSVGPRGDEWDKIKLYVRLNTPGQSNGVVRLWVNDELKLQHTNVPMRAGSTYGMNKLILSASATQQTLSNGYQWWDSWSLSMTDPDGGGDTAPPDAPTNVRIIR